MRAMNRNGNRPLGAMLARTCLGVLLVWAATASSQEPRGAASSDNRHSPGWERAMALKGDPLPPKFPKLGDEIERVVLPNGMVLYLQEDHRTF